MPDGAWFLWISPRGLSSEQTGLWLAPFSSYKALIPLDQDPSCDLTMTAS